MINNTVLTGWITYPVESKKSENGKDFVTNAVTVTRNYRNEDNEYPVDIINFVAFNHNAKYIEDYVSKGDQVVVRGRLNSRQQIIKVVDEFGNIKERKFNRIELVVDEINRVHKKVNNIQNAENEATRLSNNEESINQVDNADYQDILDSFEEFEDIY